MTDAMVPDQPTNPRGQCSSLLLAQFASVAELNDDAQAHRRHQPKPIENNSKGFIARVQ